MLITFKKIAILSVVLMSVSCANDNKDSGAGGEVDVTSEFLGTVGDNVYTHGPVTASSVGTIPATSISRSGTIKTQNIFSGSSAASDCTYVISGKIDSVVRYSDGSHWRLTYSDTDIYISSPSSPSAQCADFVSQYKFKNIPKTTQFILCGYSRENINFSCNDDKNSWANWILKN